MDMNLPHANIDFILVNYYSEDYARIAVESIYKYTKTEFNIILIDNSADKSLLKNAFADYIDRKNLHIIPGFDQEPPAERFKKPIKMYNTEGGVYGPGSLHHNKAFNLGIDLCNSNYICHLDIDSLLLAEWESDILPMLDDNLFIATEMSKGIAREYFMIWKRSEFEKYNLRPDLSYVDTCGNLTKFANDHNLTYKITRKLSNDEYYHYHLGRGTSLEQYGRISKKQEYINKWNNFFNI
jgi:hypothetical protein